MLAQREEDAEAEAQEAKVDQPRTHCEKFGKSDKVFFYYILCKLNTKCAAGEMCIVIPR